MSKNTEDEIKLDIINKKNIDTETNIDKKANRNVNIVNNTSSINNWTKYDDELLSNWGELASCYCWLYDNASKYYKKRSYIFSVPITVIQAFVSAGIFTIDKDGEYMELVTITLGAFSLIAGILSSVRDIFNYNVDADILMKSNISMSTLKRKINLEISLNPYMRQPKIKFMKDVRKEFDKIIQQSPRIPNIIIEKFNTKFRDIDIVKPDIANGLSKMENNNWFNLQIENKQYTQNIQNIQNNENSVVIDINDTSFISEKSNNSNENSISDDI